MIDPANRDLVHHLLMYECNPNPGFNDSDLPDGLCDDLSTELNPCSANIATGWAVGGDEVSCVRQREREGRRLCAGPGVP